MTENLSSLTISPFIHDSPNRRPVRSAVHNPPMMGKRIIFIFIFYFSFLRLRRKMVEEMINTKRKEEEE